MRKYHQFPVEKDKCRILGLNRVSVAQSPRSQSINLNKIEELLLHCTFARLSLLTAIQFLRLIAFSVMERGRWV